MFNHKQAIPKYFKLGLLMTITLCSIVSKASADDFRLRVGVGPNAVPTGFRQDNWRENQWHEPQWRENQWREHQWRERQYWQWRQHQLREQYMRSSYYNPYHRDWD